VKYITVELCICGYRKVWFNDFNRTSQVGFVREDGARDGVWDYDGGMRKVSDDELYGLSSQIILGTSN
jgi:hypothetical protein